MAIAIALLGFNDLGRSVTRLLFFSETDFIYNYLHIVQKRTKNQHGKLKKIQDCMKLWLLNVNLFFKEPQQF